MKRWGGNSLLEKLEDERGPEAGRWATTCRFVTAVEILSPPTMPASRGFHNLSRDLGLSRLQPVRPHAVRESTPECSGGRSFSSSSLRWERFISGRCFCRSIRQEGQIAVCRGTNPALPLTAGI